MMRALVFAIALAIGATASAQVSGQLIEHRTYTTTITAQQALVGLNRVMGDISPSCTAFDDNASIKLLHVYQGRDDETGDLVVRVFLSGLKTHTDPTTFPKGKRIVSRDGNGKPQDRANCGGTISLAQAADLAGDSKGLAGYGGANGDVLEIKIENRGGGGIGLKLVGKLYWDETDFPLNTVVQGWVP